MNLHTLAPAAGATKKAKRLGRGEASGKGGTSTKGNKGAQRSASYKQRRHSEGGQMAIQRRLPKVGFNNINRIEYKVFNLGNIEALVEAYELTSFDPESLYVVGLVNRTDLVKVLGRGEIKKAVTFKVHAASASAKAAIEAAGGTVEIVNN
jgi:large subunit ribosomal protein L15